MEHKRIVFTSRLNTANEEDANVALEQIFHCAKAFNHATKVCALMHYNPKTFNIVQLLEGPLQPMNELFPRIAQDKRHTRVQRLFDDRIDIASKWTEKRGMDYMTEQEWKDLKEKLGEKKLEAQLQVSEVNRTDLEMIDSLPLAGDLDLSLIRLVYHSKFKERRPDRAFYIMQDIVELAQKRNEKCLIGGVLHMDKDTFDVFQCLEGPANAVKTLYVAIENDSRHNNVETLSILKAEKRRYKAWGMVWATEEAMKELAASLPTEVIDKYKTVLLKAK